MSKPSEKSNLLSSDSRGIRDESLEIRFDHTVPGYAVFAQSKTKRLRLTPYFSYREAVEAEQIRDFQQHPPLRPGGEPVKSTLEEFEQPREIKPPNPPPRLAHHGARRSGDLSGLRFGQLRVLRRSTKTDCHQHRYWQCVCDCGMDVVVRGADFFSKQRTCCNRQRHAMLERRERLEEIAADAPVDNSGTRHCRAAD